MQPLYIWLLQLDEPYRSKAVKNMWWEDTLNEYPTLSKALYQAFNWSRSTEGFYYWYEQHKQIIQQENQPGEKVN